MIRLYSTENAVVPPPPTEPSMFWRAMESIQSNSAGLFEDIHNVTGLPYWGVIVASTVAFRLALAPLLVMSMKQVGKMEVIKPQLERLQAEMRMSGGYQNKEAMTKFQTEWAALRAKHGFSMWKQFAPVLGQIPGFLWLFTSMRYLLMHNPGMATGGALWFVDLTAVDSFFRLNLLTASAMFLSFKFGAESSGQQLSGPMVVVMKVFTYLMPSLYVLFTMGFGQGMHLFWMTSSLTAIAINYTLRKTSFGRWLGVPAQGISKPVVQPPASVFTTRQEALKGGINAAKLAQASRKKHSESDVKSKQ